MIEAQIAEVRRSLLNLAGYRCEIDLIRNALDKGRNPKEIAYLTRIGDELHATIRKVNEALNGEEC